MLGFNLKLQFGDYRLRRRSQLINATLYYSLSRERSVDYEAKDKDKLLSIPAGDGVGQLTELDAGRGLDSTHPVFRDKHSAAIHHNPDGKVISAVEPLLCDHGSMEN
jgi:hypothetical protein